MLGQSRQSSYSHWAFRWFLIKNSRNLEQKYFSSLFSFPFSFDCSLFPHPVFVGFYLFLTVLRAGSRLLADICRNVVGTAYPRCDDLHQLYWGRIEGKKKKRKKEKVLALQLVKWLYFILWC